MSRSCFSFNGGGRIYVIDFRQSRQVLPLPSSPELAGVVGLGVLCPECGPLFLHELFSFQECVIATLKTRSPSADLLEELNCPLMEWNDQRKKHDLVGGEFMSVGSGVLEIIEIVPDHVQNFFDLCSGVIRHDGQWYRVLH